jgi:hypothetical protein
MAARSIKVKLQAIGFYISVILAYGTTEPEKGIISRWSLDDSTFPALSCSCIRLVQQLAFATPHDPQH